MKKHIKGFMEFSLNEWNHTVPEWLDEEYKRLVLSELDDMLVPISVNGWEYERFGFEQGGYFSFYSDQMPLMEIAITPFWEWEDRISAQINCIGYFVDVNTDTEALSSKLEGDADSDAQVLFDMVRNILRDLTKDDCAEAGKILSAGLQRQGDDLGKLLLECMNEEDGIVLAMILVDSGADPKKELERSGFGQEMYERFMEWFNVEQANHKRTRKSKRLFGI